MIVLVCGLHDAGAQGIARNDYYALVPPTPRIVSQTHASAAFDLFGNTSIPDYRDVDPVDGIDDARARRLLQLAERFSPIMRRNTVSVPRDPFELLGAGSQLQVDTWENGILARVDSVLVGPRAAQRPASPTALVPAQTLESLVAELGPRRTVVSARDPDRATDRVLFLDMPGDDPRSWIRAERSAGREHTKIFAHPFIHEDPSAGLQRYQLVLQYWFFYPYNNSVNNHEGDWEFISVFVTTTRALRTALPRTNAGAQLTGDDVNHLITDWPLDSTTIGAVEYQFHHEFLTLDYVSRNIERDVLASGHDHGPRYVWEDLDLVHEELDQRLTAAAGKLSTHPVVYIGGNYKGPGELLAVVPRFYGSERRDSHASYPFPGTWQTVGPFATTEAVHGDVVPPIHDGPGVSWENLVTDDRYLTFPASRITLLPDWERVEPLLTTDPAAGRQWSWLYLPIRWGFPVSRSVAASAIGHVDLGNVAPLTPTYQETWNHVGPSAGRTRYSPHVLRTPVAPTTPWALVRNGWGVLNVPLALWGLMPGYNVALLELTPWIAGALRIAGLPRPRTYTSARIPHRFTAEGQGAFTEFGGRAFAALLPHDAASAALDSDWHRTSELGTRLWLDLFFYDRFALENSFSWHRSQISRDAAQVTGALQLQQLTGGIRYSVLSIGDEMLHGYVRGGYGWLRYATSDVRLRGTPVQGVHGGHLPSLLPSASWWPNSWYAGAGAELFSPRKAWLFGRLGFGLRVETTSYFKKVRFPSASAQEDVLTKRGDVATSLVFGW